MSAQNGILSVINSAKPWAMPPGKEQYHNIHTMYRPDTKTHKKTIHMAILLLKVFLNIKAVVHHGQNALLVERVQIKELKNFVKGNVNIY